MHACVPLPPGIDTGHLEDTEPSAISAPGLASHLTTPSKNYTGISEEDPLPQSPRSLLLSLSF